MDILKGILQIILALVLTIMSLAPGVLLTIYLLKELV